MGRKAHEFKEATVVRELAEQIVEKYDYIFKHVQLNDIYFAFCDNNPTDKSKKVILGNITNPLSQKICRSKYQIAFYRTHWYAWDEEKQLVMLFKALYSVGKEMDGKLRKPDVNDHYVMLATFGMNYDDDSFEGTLPHILNEDVAFQLPLETGDSDDADEHGDGNGPNMKPVLDQIAADIAKQNELKQV